MTANEPEAGRGPESGYAQEPTPQQEQQQQQQAQQQAHERQERPQHEYPQYPQSSQYPQQAAYSQSTYAQQAAQYPQQPVEPPQQAQPYTAYGYPQGMPPVYGQPGVASPYPQYSQQPQPPQQPQYPQQSYAPEAYATGAYEQPAPNQTAYAYPQSQPQPYATAAPYAPQPTQQPYQPTQQLQSPQQPYQQAQPQYPQYPQSLQSSQYPQSSQPAQYLQYPQTYQQYPQPGMASAYGMPYAAPYAAAYAAPYAPYANPAIAARKALNKWRRAVVNRAMGITFAYEGLMYAGVIIAEIIVMTIMQVTTGGTTMSDAEYNRWTGVFSIASLVTAVGYLLIVRHRDIFTREYWLGGPHLDTYGEPNQRGRMSQYGSGKRMTPLVALSLIALTMGVQSLITFFSLAITMLGGDLPSPTSDSIDDSMTTVSMWLYVSLLAPICEEMIFRGVLMKSLKPLGKNFAIVTTAIMFGFFHGDLVQGLFAALSGLLLGYVAMEYSLVWSIGLHFFNNAVLAGVMDTLASTYLNDTGYAIYNIGIMLFGFIVSAIVLTLGHKQIGAYVRANRSEPGTFAGWASWTLIGFMVFNGGQAIFSFVGALLS